MTPRATERRRAVFLAGLVLAAVVGFVYSGSLRTPFLFDDADAVTDNPTIRHLFSFDILRTPTDGSATTGRPVVNATYALNYALSGEQVWSYHALNLTIHVLAALLLFGLVRRTCTLQRERDRAVSGSAPLDPIWFAFAAALLWAIHPLQTETVVTAAQRTESLCGLFYLLTLYSFLRGAELDSPDAAPLSIGVEPTAIPTLPPVVPSAGLTSSLSATPFGRPGASAMPQGKAVVSTGPIATVGSSVVSPARLAVTSSAPITPGVPAIVAKTDAAVEAEARAEGQGFPILAPRRSRAASVWFGIAWIASALGMATKEVMVTAPVLVFLFDRTFVAGSVRDAWRQRGGVHIALAATWFILLALLWNDSGSRGSAAGFGLGVSSCQYLLTQAEALLVYLKLVVWPYPLVLDYGTHVAPSLLHVWWEAPIVLAALVGAGWAIYRRPRLGFLAATFFIVLAPSSSFVPLVTQTMAEHRMYLPLAAVIVMMLAAVMRCRRVSAVGLLLGCAALAAITMARVHEYRDPLLVWTANVLNHPASARGHNNRAVLLANRGDLREADAEYARAVALDPKYVTARYDWGVLLLRRQQYAEAIDQLKAAVALAPNHVDARVNLGNALVRAGRSAEAVAHYAAALRLRPAADVHYGLGVALLEVGHTRDAIEQFQSALAQQPNLVDAHYQLAVAAEREGDTSVARDELRETVRRAPTHAAALRRLGMLEAHAGNMAAAADCFRVVVGLNPTDVDSLANLGNVLLVDGQVNAAIACYERALRLRPDDAKLKENLAIAHAALEQSAAPAPR